MRNPIAIVLLSRRSVAARRYTPAMDTTTQKILLVIVAFFTPLAVGNKAGLGD